MGEPLLNVSFYGVRGSTPCGSEDNRRYGGNTSCVALEAPGHEPIVLDLGTGLRFFGETQPQDGTFKGSALVTHLHWDHVQGLPFFTPVLKPGSRLDIYGPRQEAGTVGEAFRRFICPPFFPVTVEQLYGQMSFYDVEGEDIELDGAKVRVRPVPHVGANNGYRVEIGGAAHNDFTVYVLNDDRYAEMDTVYKDAEREHGQTLHMKDHAQPLYERFEHPSRPEAAGGSPLPTPAAPAPRNDGP